ncbi:monocarboxylate transporter 9 isoform X2 [Bactrocera oleae]|uniref:monocarboxylate transporter 9 isoform X2 n=1 Tax=Bactrocera oleae TaxID=104688 RepID=UPI00387E9898
MRKSKSSVVPPPNDVTPYYSVQSVDSRTDRSDPRIYLSALPPTPQPSPVQYTNKRSQASASTSTEPPIKPITAEFGAQTSVIKEFTQAGTDFSMQTTASLADGDKSDETNKEEDKRESIPIKAVKRSTVEDAESNVTEASADRAETHSSASQFHIYDREQDSVLEAGRVKKLTKQRHKTSSPPSIESSFISAQRFSAKHNDDYSSNEEASLESQAYKYFADDPNANRYDKRTRASDPPFTNQNDQNELPMQEWVELNQPSQGLGSVKRVGSSSSTLSSEPYLDAGFPTNLQLGDGFLYMTIPPDGGYGWFIVVISFFCQVIVDGIIFSVGILLPHIAEDLGETQTAIVLVASVQVGPVASAFINKYGFRVVALIGAISSIIFILIGTFSYNMAMLIVFYSVLGGPALSLIWVSSQLIIGYYFERYRPIANGVSCAGAGAGILIFSFMNAHICPEIGWRNTSRIHTAILSLVLIMGLTFIEVTPTRIATVKKDEKSSSSSEERMSVPFSQIRYSRYQQSITVKPTSYERGLEQMIEEYEPQRTTKIARLCPCCLPTPPKPRKETAEMVRSIEEEPDVEAEPEQEAEKRNFLVRIDPIEREDLFYTGAAAYDSDLEVNTRRTTNHLIDIDHRRARTIKYSLSVMRSQRSYDQRKRRTLSELRNRHKWPYLAYISPINWMPPKLLNAFARLFDMNMLKIMEFRILLLSAFFFPMGFNIPFVYSKTRAEVDPFNASLISPTIGLSNFVFRIISGFAANKYRSQTTYMCGGGIVFGGIATLASAFYGEDVVWFQYTYAACYGVAPAFFSTLRAIIYVRALGLDKLTNAFGLTGLAMGLGVFLGTTTAAILNGLTHRYNAAFAFSGICLITAGVLKLILPTLMRYRAKRLNNA